MSTRDIVFIALFAALTAALGIFPPLTLPIIAVPITAQSMGPLLAGSILGAKRGALSVVLFIVLVAIGMPLLAGGRGGLGIFYGPTAGFIFGWVASAFVTGALFERYWNSLNVWKAGFFAFIGGVVVLYAIGMVWVSVMTGLPLAQVAISSAPFLIGDAIKIAAVALVSVTVRNTYPLIIAKSA
ncbi:biotin transporter BioY [Limoniibacter endophyticus]|uniref:Biotin transporter n=1 Tax=Limoniibacter endophyticus TaxID=1565040 RepID=A0A8J3DFT8_9HYPH|nr:biotin transporter BioY [Limoniibacter endophyticus]GHC67194.1 BioY family transporter [Limoniibacter endophyticus]